ncbi:MAG: bifunctional riboflavin kinase/FAD synthetase [Nevskia sp.]|nr:bifunctional riboflavin kinase/FAD synthetase [Nevskia sp.]
MELIRGLHNLAPRHRGCVVSIGNFDGLHLGHRALIARLQELSRLHASPSAVMIFEPTPREFLAPESAPPRITGFRGKLRLLQRAGIDRLLLVRFDRRLAQLAARDFVQRILVEGLGARAVVVGEDFRFGHKRGGDLELLRSMGLQAGFEVEGLDSVLVGSLRCSSTAVREALAVPDLERAQELLGRRYRAFGRVRRGLQLGRKLGMSTANLMVRYPGALAHGVYAVRAYWPERPQGAPGVASLGVRPTLGMTACLLETHVFGESPALYGKELEIEFWRYLRPQQRFDSLDALATQMQADGAQARAFFGLTGEGQPAPAHGRL